MKLRASALSIKTILYASPYDAPLLYPLLGLGYIGIFLHTSGKTAPCPSPRSSCSEKLKGRVSYLFNRPTRPLYSPQETWTDQVLLSQSAREAFDSLSSIAEVVTPKSDNLSEFLQECRNGAFDGLRAAYRTVQSVRVTGRIEGEVCEELGKTGLRFLAHNGG